jgi:hypothetical protein
MLSGEKGVQGRREKDKTVKERGEKTKDKGEIELKE